MNSILNITIKETVLRNSAILLFFILGCMNIMAQEVDEEYVPFVEEGKVWNCFSSFSFLITPDVIFKISGDTLINENSYKKVYCQFDTYYEDDGQHYYCAVREEECRVYIIESNKNVEKLLYDFSNPQEALTLSYDERDFVRCSGYHQKPYPDNQFIFQIHGPGDEDPLYPDFVGVWLEGAGNIYSSPFGFEKVGTDSSFGVLISVHSCINSAGEYLFNKKWIPQKPTDSIQEIIKNSHNSNIYDLQGRRLSEKPAKGICIQNGKKIVTP